MSPPRSSRRLLALVAIASLAGAACAETPPPGSPSTVGSAAAPAPTASSSAVARAPDPWAERGAPRIVADAQRLAAVVKSDGTKRFLAQARALPKVATRTLYHDADKTHYYTEAEAALLQADVRARLTKIEQNEEDYYNTHYGSPLSYSRPLDILFSTGASISPGSRLMDFGYGYIGHLRLLASMGVHTTGVDTWPLLRPLYSWPGDQGEITGPGGEKGSIRLIDGQFPKEPKVVSAVGAGYDVIISKNVLKKGYIHPDRPVPHPERQIQLGVSDEVALKAFFEALRPGGYFLVYNICPAPTPPDKPFVPYTDGRSPFTKSQWETAGFQVLVIDRDDTEAVRLMAHTIGWDQPSDGEPGMDLINDLSVLYTLVQKPASH